MRSALLLSCVLLAACGGSTAQAPASDSGTAPVPDSASDSATDAAVDSAPFQDAGAAPACPANAPAPGSACPAVGFECQYGSNILEACTQIAACKASGWDLSGPTGGCTSSQCPVSYASLTDGGLQSCAQSMQVTDCWYPQGVCQCSAGLGGPAQPLGWYCVPVAPGCPYPTPTPGSACTTPGQICGGTCGGAGVECDGGTWRANVSPCPV